MGVRVSTCSAARGLKTSHTTLVGNVLDRIIADAGYRGHNAPPELRLRVYTAGHKRRVTDQIKREFKRRAAIEPMIGHLKQEHRMGRSFFAHATGDAINAVLAAVGPHLKQQWVIAPDASAAFVANMEDVLAVYQRPRDPAHPVVCLDETSKQMIVETRQPIPAKPGRKARHDYEYTRNGVANLFMMFAPLEGWRHVKVTDRHTAIDYAHALRDLSDMHFPDAAKIVLVQDNLSTHKSASLYEAFPAPEARRLAERFEWHYTPKHGSWLDMAESELSVLSTQCLDRRIPDKQILTNEVAAWQRNRNTRHAKADWQFTTADARVKLKSLYPQFE